jgi:hypothetical protein
MPLSPSMAMRLQSQHDSIPELIGNLPEVSLRQAIRPGKWSIQENIAHLAGYHDVFIDRLRRMDNVTEWTEFFLLHEAHHLYTIFLLVRDLRKSLQ